MLVRSLVAMAARRLASDPKLRAKATDLAKTHAKPLVERKAKAVQETVRAAEPGTHPARVAGRAFKRLIDG
ncbi:MAG: hypothetical protein Kilf2KO_33260 [Rhodospirillales bacterium]